VGVGNPPVLRFEHIAVEFETGGERLPALRDVNLDLWPGEFVSIVGPSGCGKSTLLNVAVGLQQPSTGAVYFHGEARRGVNTQIGYVTQEDNLFPWRTALACTEFGMEVRGVPREERRERARQLLAAVGLEGFEHYYRHQLSGGMRQRVNIIRTLAYRPDVILMDEPFGPLDAQTRIQLQYQLLQLWEEERPAILFVTHDLTEAIALADRVVIMGRRPGQVRAVHRVGLTRPRDLYRIVTYPEFPVLYAELWDMLRTEVQQDDGSRRTAGWG